MIEDITIQCPRCGSTNDANSMEWMHCGLKLRASRDREIAVTLAYCTILLAIVAVLLLLGLPLFPWGFWVIVLGIFLRQVATSPR